MKLKQTKLFFTFLLANFCIQFAFSVPGDTVKGIIRFIPLTGTDMELVENIDREIFFPQFFIYKGVKEKKITPYKPESDAWAGKTEFEKERRDSFYVRSSQIEIADSLGNLTGELVTQYYELSNTTAYRFYEEITPDENSFRIFVNVKGITLFFEDYERGSTTVPIFYFDNSATKNIAIPDYSLLAGRRDTL
ncbi:MAG: hypothetical protein IAF38_17965, partial [Bacteroidia bacterium]|nr:hypothetical protein [Bacteroidia bacterium]